MWDTPTWPSITVVHMLKHVLISVLHMRKQVLQCTSTITHLPGHINTSRELLPNGLDDTQAYIMVYVPWYQTVRKTTQKHAHISALYMPKHVRITWG